MSQRPPCACGCGQTPKNRTAEYVLGHRPPVPLEDRFWARVDKSAGPGGCWPWDKPSKIDGYGRVSLYPLNQFALAHRLAYELIVGEIPEGLTLDHLCHTRDSACPGGPACAHRRCVNPRHLEPVTLKVNTLRGRSPVAETVRTGKCQRGHDLLEHAYQHPDGYRVCRRCATDGQRERRAARRVAA